MQHQLSGVAMNNIEVEQLKRDVKKYLKIEEEELGFLSEKKLISLKKEIMKIKNQKEEKSSRKIYEKNQIKKRVDEIFEKNPKLKESRIIGGGVGGGKKPKPHSNIGVPRKQFYFDQKEVKKVQVDPNRKPKILFISDVKGWAWWIKSEYLKKYLSNEFNIDVTCVLGNGCVPVNKIDQMKYDLYFTFGFSYIDFLSRVGKNKKVTGITAHRRKNVIFPKMKIAGHVHANSKLLLKELHEMGFKKAYYLPNGVDADLFRPIEPIKKDGELIVGHVGKECPVKGQREYIIPAIQSAKAKSATNLRTWKDRLPHTEMPTIYNQMDVFVVASIEDGTPNPALEAAACGRPIISKRIGNMPELIKDGYNGFIVPRKIGEYVNKIRYFQDNRSELIRMGENARKTILEGWTWKKQAENYREMFRDIFEKQKK